MIDQANVLMARDRRPRIETYRFGRAASRLWRRRGRESVREPRDDETRLTSALEQLPSRFDDGMPFGVFLFSDGRSTESRGLRPGRGGLSHAGVPIHVFPVGDERVSGDVAIQAIDAPRNAAAGTRVPVRVTLRSRGYDGQRVELQIRRPDRAEGGAAGIAPRDPDLAASKLTSW